MEWEGERGKVFMARLRRIEKVGRGGME